ncbi:MAG: LuxR C-terminal-related transcriptional regulator [Sulfurimonas sp.]
MSDKKIEKIILFTRQNAIKKHWSDALVGHYETEVLASQEQLLHFLAQDDEKKVVMVDEDSLDNLAETLAQLKRYAHATLLFFKSVPEVEHASMVIGKNIKAYENAFIDKSNLLLLLQKVQSGKSWLFADLTHYIISKFIQDKSSDEPEFVSKLTQTEKDISIMVAHGLSNKEIAEAKGIALSTVKGHMQHIFKKAGVTDRVSLALQFK